MIKNFLMVALRNFRRNSLHTTINILGLVIGITFSLLLCLLSWHETQIDQYHEDGDRLYRAYFNGVNENGEFTFTQGASPYPLYATLTEFSEVEKATIFDGAGEMVFTHEGKIHEEVAHWATPSFFEVFTLPFLSGGLPEVKDNPNTMFISEEVAERIFGPDWQDKTVGTTLNVNQVMDFTIAGVFENVSALSSVRFDIILNANAFVATRPQEWHDDWGNKASTVFAKLREGADPRKVEAQVNAIYKDKPGYGVGGEAVMLFPFEKNYLWTKFEKGIAVGGGIQYVRIFLGAALFLLAMACINFINLATAQASRRAKEVGVRKTVGANKRTLIFQFLFEASTLIFLAIVLALVGTQYLLAPVNALTEKSITIPTDQPVFWFAIAGLWAFLTLMAGLYPSFVLSHFQPVKVLKNNLSSRFAHKNIRKGLVVFQFVLSAFLIMASLIVHRQINFIQKENLGLDRNNIIHFNLLDPVRDQYPLLKEKLKNHASINEVLTTTSLPTEIDWIQTEFDWENRDPNDGAYFYQIWTDFGLDRLAGIEMKEGRFFKEEIKTDSQGVVLNEKALDYIQLEDPVGKVIRAPGGHTLTILGVVKNFSFQSIHNEVEPLMIGLNPDYGSTVMIKPKDGATKEAIAHLEATWKELIPDLAIEYAFLDESYAQMYEVETTVGQIAWVLAAIAIIISCLGLFGLVTFIAAQKTKEIGIRKVLGASVMGIIRLLTKEYVYLILLGLIIAIPLAWYGMNQWLQNYAYRASIDWWIFGAAAVALVAIGFSTILVQSLRAAVANPVEALRNE